MRVLVCRKGVRSCRSGVNNEQSHQNGPFWEGQHKEKTSEGFCGITEILRVQDVWIGVRLLCLSLMDSTQASYCCQPSFITHVVKLFSQIEGRNQTKLQFSICFHVELRFYSTSSRITKWPNEYGFVLSRGWRSPKWS